ncbi:MAG: hypothetical protein JTT15_02345 [Candidatus Brockarchaeota archaeon]|nr:hypothetical protein [Candidatus Brockarchaeota archaeon]
MGEMGEKHTLIPASNFFKKALTSMGFLLLGLLLLSSMLNLITYATTAPGIKNIQYLDLTISVIDHYGAPVENAYVVVFELAENGPIKLSEGFTDFTGKYKASFKIPRKTIYLTMWKVDEAGNLYIDSHSQAIEAYAPVNLWIITHKTSEESGKQTLEIGTLTFSIDPSEMKHPVDKLEKTITISKIEPQKQKTEDSKDIVGASKTTTTTSCQIPTYPYQEEKWEYTSVLKFATWDNISAIFTFLPGSNIFVESKERYFLISSCSYTSWNSGYTTIKLDYGFGISEPVTGRYIYDQRVKLKYYFIRFWPPYQSSVLVEKVYAVDTNVDGAEISDIKNDYKTSWSGLLPSWSYFITLPQKYNRIIEITGKSASFTISTGVSLSFYIGVSVSLGVGKAPSPVSYLIITADKWIDNYKVKIVSNDGTFLQTYSNWVPP